MAPATTCFCGATFGTRVAFRDHVSKHGHQYQCECKTLVATEKALNDHLDGTKHSSSETTFSAKDVRIKAPDLDKCAICGYHNSEAVQLQQHLFKQHHGCPTCVQVFTSTAQRLCHQRSVSHCYCGIHHQVFPDVESFSQHTRLDGHNQDFTCVECDRSFKTESAFEHHMNSDGHKEVVIEAINKSYQRLAETKLAEANLYCEPCDRKFCNLEAFQKHKASVKHNPLSDLKCPLSNGCLGTFTSPSALLFHLESGGCKSGMTRSKLNAIIFKHDTNGRITVASQANHVLKAAASQASINPHSSASQHVTSLQSASSSSFGGGLITPDLTSDTGTIRGGGSVIALEEDTDDTGSELKGFSDLTLNDTVSGASGGAVLTPSASTISANGGAPVSSSSSDSGVILTPSASLARSDWSYVFSSMVLTPASTSVDGSSVDTIRFDTEKKRWICLICSDTFRKKYDLIQHINSPRHGSKIFHCPTGLPGLSASSKPTLEFKTASGLAQHVEAGSCHGGKEMLGYITGLIEAQITEALGKTVKLLKE